MRNNPHGVLLAFALCGAAGCSGEGSLHVTIYGEAFIEEGIPAAEVADGWAIGFDRFLVAVDEMSADGAPLPGAFVFDLTQPSDGAGHDVGTIAVPEGTVEHLDYRIVRATAATAGNATREDVDLMTSMKYSLFVEGAATRGAEMITFAWGFATTTRYLACETDQAVPEGGEATSQITIHADHLFLDDLDLPDPSVRFDLIAAGDANMDGEVTPDELRAVDISAEANYGVGSRDIAELWSFIAAQTQTVGHIDGEGHCEFE